MKHFFVLALAVALAFGAACGDDSGGGAAGGAAGSGGSGADAPVSEMISAAEGGKLTTGGAELDIPADALADDTEVTVEVVDKAGLPDEDNIASEVFDFGPDGTTFDKPVTLTIDFDASATPDGMTAVMAFQDGDTWEPLADSEISGDTVVATTTHFTHFAVVWTAEGAMQTEGMCDTTKFDACGGDVVGEWKISLGCLTLPDALLMGSLDGFDNCEGAAVSADADVTGTVTFNDDGSFSSDVTFATDIVFHVPKSCLPMGATCADLGKDGEPPMDVGDACEQHMPDSKTEMDMGTYEIDASNNTLTTTGMDMTADAPEEYCVSADGKTLTVRFPGSDKDPEVMLVADKQ